MSMLLATINGHYIVFLPILAAKSRIGRFRILNCGVGMMKSIFLAIVALSLVQTAHADVVFSVGRTGGPAIIEISEGGTFVLDIYVHKDPSDSRTLTMSGFDFNLLAGVGNGSQGTFTGGSLIVLGSRTIDFTSTPGQAFATSASDASNPPITVGTTDVQLGSVVLSTAGLAVGSKFDITLSDLNFNDVVLGPIASTGAGVSFQITAAAVPEPTTLLLLLGTSGCAMVFRRWRARSPHQPANR